MFSLSRHPVLDILFSGEVFFCLAFALSMGIVVRAVASYFRDSGALHTRLAQIEAELSVLHAGIPGKLEVVRQLQHELKPLRETFNRIRGYLSRLQHLERKWMEEEAERERAEEAEAERMVKIRRLGLDRPAG